MESRKLGNKTKIIKIMSKVGNYGLIILTKLSMKETYYTYPLNELDDIRLHTSE